MAITDYFFGMSPEEIKDFEEAQNQIQAERVEAHHKDTMLIRRLKTILPKKLFKAICSSLHESDNWTNIRVVDKPTGKKQHEINKGYKYDLWVDQYCEGEDCYSGYCYIELPDKTFIAWNYWM